MTEDLFIRTARQQRFVDLAAGLANQFAARAAVHDKEGSFPYENIEALRAAGYTRLTVPAEFGGEAATLTETLLAQERLGQGDASTALAVGWHLAGVGKQRETRTWPAATFERVCREVVRQGALLNSVASEVETGSPSRGGRPTTTARPAPGGGWLLTGRKAFATLSPALAYALVSAGIENDPGGGWFLVPMDAPGVTIVETWDSLGMRATASNDLVLQDVHLPDEALVEEFGRGKTCQIGTGSGAGWLLHIPATYLGVARAARDFALEYARTRKPNSLAGPIADLPHIQAQLGRIETDLYAARSAVYMAAQRWDDEPGSRQAMVPLLGAAKVVATNAAIQVVDTAMRICGIASLSRQLPLERYYRDVRAGLHNPPMEDAALTALARAALNSK
jgi:alkylation response protein AidB-like acyl-CoA dehydrogenase